MITASERLAQFEAAQRRTADARWSYATALERFTALWVEARQVSPSWEDNWRTDLDADLAVARAVNGLPPTS